jgi:putative endopeptidase
LSRATGSRRNSAFSSATHKWACENERPENLRVTAITDPHSPGKYRVNGLVVNMDEFQKAFSCKAGQPMVRENRCRVW